MHTFWKTTYAILKQIVQGTQQVALKVKVDQTVNNELKHSKYYFDQ